MTTGTVKFFNEGKGYGFIAPDDGSSDAFVHISAVERAGMHSLREKQRITYDLERDNRGKTSAVNLQAVEEPTRAEPSGEQPANDDETQAPSDQQAE